MSNIIILLGGIFLGASLVGMLPEVREIFNQQNIGWNGYMLVLYILQN